MTIAVTRVALALLVLSCGGKATRGDLAALCEGREAQRTVVSTIDSVTAHAGASLTGLRGRSFTLELTLQPAPATGPDAGTGGAGGCDGRMGSGRFGGDVPEPLRGATAPEGNVSWRVQGDTLLLDLNPGTRDNNLFMVLPLHGGAGHWNLSTFAGDVARGAVGRD